MDPRTEGFATVARGRSEENKKPTERTEEFKGRHRWLDSFQGHLDFCHGESALFLFTLRILPAPVSG